MQHEGAAARIAITRAILAGELDTLVARRAQQLGWREPEVPQKPPAA